MLDFSSKWRYEKEKNLYFSEGEEPQTQRQLFYEQYFNFIKKYVPMHPDMSVLDLGCGRGTMGQFFRGRAGIEDVTFLDESIEAIALAKDNFGLSGKFIVGSALELPFQDETFDIVVSMGVSEHVENYPKFFYEQMRVLKKGGYLICMTVPHKRSIQMLNILSRDHYHRDEHNTTDDYVKFLKQTTDYEVAEIWLNPFPLFTPVPRWIDYVISHMYRDILWIRKLFKADPFSGSKALSQSHFIITRRSS